MISGKSAHTIYILRGSRLLNPGWLDLKISGGGWKSGKYTQWMSGHLGCTVAVGAYRDLRPCPSHNRWVQQLVAIAFKGAHFDRGLPLVQSQHPGLQLPRRGRGRRRARIRGRHRGRQQHLQLGLPSNLSTQIYLYLPLSEVFPKLTPGSPKSLIITPRCPRPKPRKLNNPSQV